MGRYSKKRNRFGLTKKNKKYKNVRYSAHQRLKPKHKSKRRAYYNNMSGGGNVSDTKSGVIPTVSSTIIPTVSSNPKIISTVSPTVSSGVIPTVSPNVSAGVIPTVSENATIPTISSDATIIPTLSEDAPKELVPTLSDNAPKELVPTLSEDAPKEIVPTVSENLSNEVKESNETKESNEIKESTEESVPEKKEINPLVALTELTKGSCNSEYYNDLVFIIDDFNGVLANLMPMLDDNAVETIIQFIKLFNEKFETDPAFRAEFDRGITNIIGVVKDAGQKTVGSGTALIVQILTNLVHAIPGVGAVVSILKAANNVTESISDITTSTQKAATEWKKFMNNMESMANMSAVSDIVTKEGNELKQNIKTSLTPNFIKPKK